MCRLWECPAVSAISKDGATEPEPLWIVVWHRLDHYHQDGRSTGGTRVHQYRYPASHFFAILLDRDVESRNSYYFLYFLTFLNNALWTLQPRFNRTLKIFASFPYRRANSEQGRVSPLNVTMRIPMRLFAFSTGVTHRQFQGA